MRNLAGLSLKLTGNQLEVLDQTCLPQEEKWISISHPKDLIECIHRLAVRGAPLIGISASLSWALFSLHESNHSELKLWWQKLRDSRPTAVNLMNNLDRMARAFESGKDLLEEACEIFDEDVRLCEQMSERGAALIQDGDKLITHCNTGGLATAGVGTALGVIQKAHQQGKKIHVYVDETRPLLQGSRLTAWELNKLNIPFTLICDNMAAALMSQNKINGVFVGADRIAVNGDCANKIGTYSLAISAKYHQVPFYVVAPRTTYDATCPDGRAIPIEQRPTNEVIGPQGLSSAAVWNPAFDVTPRNLISKIILDDGFL